MKIKLQNLEALLCVQQNIIEILAFRLRHIQVNFYSKNNLALTL